ncbi:MAG: LysR substrate-binding domain-containing protein [Acidobacteriota bacterium]
MGVRDLSLRDLTYVVAVAEERHFGRAAEHCHISQPALSAQVRKVERVLGAKLFERNRRRVLLTQVGERVVDQAWAVLREADHLGELARSAGGVLVGPFRLGLILTLGPYLLPHLLGPLRELYPDLELILTEGLTEQLLDALRGGRLDAVLFAPLPDTTGFEIEVLFFEPFLLATPHSHPLSTKRRLTLEDLKREEMVLLNDGHCLREQTLQFCPSQRAGKERLQTAGLETLRHLVASGAGYSLLPSLAVRKDPQLSDLLVYRAFDGPQPGRDVALCWREGSPRRVDLTALAALVRDCLPEGLPLRSGDGFTAANSRTA